LVGATERIAGHVFDVGRDVRAARILEDFEVF
jgi:hypothetical protein